MSIDLEQLKNDINAIEMKIIHCRSKHEYITLTRDLFSLCFIYNNLCDKPYQEKIIYNSFFDAYELEQLDAKHHDFLAFVTDNFSTHLEFTKHNLECLDDSSFSKEAVKCNRRITGKEAKELILDFANFIGDGYYKIVCDMIKNNRIGFAPLIKECPEYLAYTEHSYSLKKSYAAFHMENFDVASMSAIAHELGHCYELKQGEGLSRHITIYSALYPTSEVVSMIFGALLTDYLRNIDDFKADADKVMKDELDDMFSQLLELNMILNLNNPVIDINSFDVLSKSLDRKRAIREISEDGNHRELYYHMCNINNVIFNNQLRPMFNMKSSLLYSYGGVFAFNFLNYYREDKKETLKMLKKMMIETTQGNLFGLMNKYFSEGEIIEGKGLKLFLGDKK